MKVKLCLLFILHVAAWADMSAECNMAAFYQELGCSPMKNNGTCPDAFVCPDLHPDPKQCFYKGRSYPDKNMIPQNLVNNPCSQVCMCVVGREASFQCAAVDCVESFDSDMEQCIYTYDLDSCCYTGTVCGKDDIANLKTCEVDGQTFKEGQQFYPKNTRKTCICTGQWNGSVDDVSYCRDINCGVEIHFQQKLTEKCAPVYLTGDGSTCPIGFQCQTNASKLIRGLNIRNINTRCVFGNMTMLVGDEVTADDPCVKCKCEVPPFVTCRQGPRKDKDSAC